MHFINAEIFLPLLQLPERQIGNKMTLNLEKLFISQRL